MPASEPNQIPALEPDAELLRDLHFAEAPRWRDGRLWFSEIFGHRIMAVDTAGRSEVVADLGDDLPSGLGFLPDGTILVACLNRPVVLAVSPGAKLSMHADLSDLAVGALNDMVVDASGRAYVGSMGTNPSTVPRPVEANGNVILIEPDGTSRIVADQMDAPNGPAISRDGRTYVVAEFPASRLIGFDRLDSGDLGRRRVWADLAPGSADGIAIDAADGVWIASPRENECRRVLEGGHVTDRVRLNTDHMPIACALGGSDHRTLFILSATGGEEAIRNRTCRSIIETARVSVPGW